MRASSVVQSGKIRWKLQTFWNSAVSLSLRSRTQCAAVLEFLAFQDHVCRESNLNSYKVYKLTDHIFLYVCSHKPVLEFSNNNNDDDDDNETKYL